MYCLGADIIGLKRARPARKSLSSTPRRVRYYLNHLKELANGVIWPSYITTSNIFFVTSIFSSSLISKARACHVYVIGRATMCVFCVTLYKKEWSYRTNFARDILVALVYSLKDLKVSMNAQLSSKYQAEHKSKPWSSSFDSKLLNYELYFYDFEWP